MLLKDPQKRPVTSKRDSYLESFQNVIEISIHFEILDPHEFDGLGIDLYRKWMQRIQKQLQEKTQKNQKKEMKSSADVFR